MRFIWCEHDCYVYIKDVEKEDALYLLLYVDDMLVPIGRSMEAMKGLKRELSTEFEMKDLDPVKMILRMEICKNMFKGVLHLLQEEYVHKLLERFRMEKAKPIEIPLSSHISLSKYQSPQSEEEREHIEKVPCANAVGSVMYTMVCCRSDIAHVVSSVSKYMANPGKEH